MGRATRWFKGLFGMKSARKDRQRPAAGIGGSGRESHFCHNPATIPPNITPAEASWLGSYYPEAKDDDEAAQNKHAIAVAAATAAAADAAIAAAQAAAQVVRLRSQGRSLSRSKNNLLGGSCPRHNRAAVRIQSNFRAHLARKALRALKGLVKIQALVRGYLVRKQASATLRGMQALIRAQASVRSKRAFVNTPPSITWSETLSASSTLEQDAPKVVEVDSGHNWPAPNTSFSAQFAPARAHHCCRHFDSGSTTAQTTPRLFSNPSPPTKGRPGEGDILEGWETQRLYYEYPSYMAKTVSFKAKVRSQSAPKQRSEGHKKRMSLSGVMEGRSSVGMQRSSSHVDHEVVNFRDAVMCRLQNSHFSSYN